MHIITHKMHIVISTLTLSLHTRRRLHAALITHAALNRHAPPRKSRLDCGHHASQPTIPPRHSRTHSPMNQMDPFPGPVPAVVHHLWATLLLLARVLTYFYLTERISHSDPIQTRGWKRRVQITVTIFAAIAEAEGWTPPLWLLFDIWQAMVQYQHLVGDRFHRLDGRWEVVEHDGGEEWEEQEGKSDGECDSVESFRRGMEEKCERAERTRWEEEQRWEDERRRRRAERARNRVKKRYEGRRGEIKSREAASGGESKVGWRRGPGVRRPGRK